MKTKMEITNVHVYLAILVVNVKYQLVIITISAMIIHVEIMVYVSQLVTMISNVIVNQDGLVKYVKLILTIVHHIHVKIMVFVLMN